MGMCTALHDWCEQEDENGYTWAECAQCGAVEYNGDNE